MLNLCKINYLEFFKKHGVGVMTVKELFDFITDPAILEASIDQYLDTIAEQVTLRELHDIDPNSQVEDQVFKQAYIPQRLDEVYKFFLAAKFVMYLIAILNAFKSSHILQVLDIDKDMSEANAGEQHLLHKTLSGINADLPKVSAIPSNVPSPENEGNSDTENEDDEGESDEESEDNDKSKFVNSARPRDESPESKKVSTLKTIL